ncbi:aldose 1-epimerase family protein [Streptococcus parasanguinis]|uniref:Aldose 1-epimerase family protein n=1 Tax=Streptococcus parasanguinis TaxID=1318 RepID=A0AAE8AYU2_STRPA|nr:aldose 1-epimerase family protein [Streptococcus parasanguinis]RHN26291.1 aldose 1-epimerase family protein [Streptococcus parasanguinis]
MVIALKNGDLELQFKTFGGELSSIRSKEGIEYLWQGDPEYWSGQAPVLFPICGSVRNGQVQYHLKDGVKTGQLPRHGLIRKREFELKEQTDHRLVFEITYNDESLQNYPYHFRVEIIYELQGKEITITNRVQNLESDQVMPYFIGGHPAFRCPLLADEDYEDYELIFEKEESCSVPLLFTETGLVDRLQRTPFLDHSRSLPLRHELFEKDAIILDQLASKSVQLLSKKSGKGLEFAFADFENLVLWSTNNKGPFIALEPWTGISTSAEEGDFFEDKKGVIQLAPQETRSHQYRITIL